MVWQVLPVQIGKGILQMSIKDQAVVSPAGIIFDFLIRSIIVVGLVFLSFYLYVVQRTSGIPFGAGDWSLVLKSAGFTFGAVLALSGLLVLLAWNCRELFRRYWFRDLSTPMQIIPKKCWSCGYERSQDQNIPCSECGASMFPGRRRIMSMGAIVLAIVMAIICTSTGAAIGELQVRSDEASLREIVTPGYRGSRDRAWPGIGSMTCEYEK